MKNEKIPKKNKSNFVVKSSHHRSNALMLSINTGEVCVCTQVSCGGSLSTCRFEDSGLRRRRRLWRWRRKPPLPRYTRAARVKTMTSQNALLGWVGGCTRTAPLPSPPICHRGRVLNGVSLDETIRAEGLIAGGVWCGARTVRRWRRARTADDTMSNRAHV